MVALQLVHKSNAQLRTLGPGLVALFVGGTSGIGEYTLKAFIQNTTSSRVYLVGRSAQAAERIIKECGTLDKDAKVEFFQADVTELRDVDRICVEVARKEDRINLIVQTQGNLALRGRDESPEGLDRKFTLNYYSRMRFIINILPQLDNAASSPPYFSRSLSILGAGNEARIDANDLDLKTNFSAWKVASHTTVMNDFMAEELAVRNEHISFVHSFPSIVLTPVTRELPLFVRIIIKILSPAIRLFAISAAETGARQLFIATSAMYPPAKYCEGSAASAGVPVPDGLKSAKGANGELGSGGYIINWNGEPTGKKEILKEYRDQGIAEKVYQHTIQIFERVEKINRERADCATA